jgi:hypothetical protein
MTQEKSTVEPGPIEVLASQVKRREISLEHAESLAQDPRVQHFYTPVYLRKMTESALGIAIEGRWRDAVLVHRLTLAAVEALPQNPEKESQRQRAGEAWLQIATSALIEVPDGRLFRHALGLGERLLRAAEAQSRRTWDLLFGLGVLHLDAYTAERSSIDYEQQLHRWRERLKVELGGNWGHIPVAELEMPAPQEALRTAQSYFERALAVSDGHLKGRTLKALAQTLEWRAFLGAKIPPEKIAGTARESLSLLSSDKDPHIRASAAIILGRNSSEPDINKSFFVEKMAETYVKEEGPAATIDMAHSAALSLKDRDPARSLEILAEVEPLLEKVTGESLRERHLHLKQGILLGGISKLKGKIDQRAKGRLAHQAEKLAEQARIEGWTVVELGATLMDLASQSPDWNGEREGLKVLDVCQRFAPGFTEAFPGAIDFLACHLLVGVASNEVQEGRFEQAVKAYASALLLFLDLRLTGFSISILERIADLMPEGSPRAVETTIALLASTAVKIERLLGAAGTRLVQNLCKESLATLVRHGPPLNQEALWMILHVPKGLRFAAALHHRPSLYDWRKDELGRALLERVSEAEGEVGCESQEAPSPENFYLDEEILLTAYSRPEERQSGDTPQERLANLQHAYDDHLASVLLGSVEADLDLDLPLTFASTQVALDERTVLLSYFLGTNPGGGSGFYVALVTRENAHLFVGNVGLPNATILAGEVDSNLSLNWFSLPIRSLRSHIEDEPGPFRVVRPEAAETLSENIVNFLGPAMPMLRSLRQAGKDHLCFVPHGPFHFYPFHLLGEAEKPLASEWIITYLPNLQLLESTAGEAAKTRMHEPKISILGLSFDNESRSRQLPGARDECRLIAELYDVEPILDAAATQEAFLEALRRSSYVHLATHARHNVVAPAFQYLELAAGAGSDGRLFAYEVLALDLRSIELLTLSACETGLGRFDLADNLRGLPASFLLAGVATIISALWPVSDLAATKFFTEFYSQIKSGRPKLDAFAYAQRSTRAQFPEYRDWGAFYLAGDWR